MSRVRCLIVPLAMTPQDGHFIRMEEAATLNLFVLDGFGRWQTGGLPQAR